MIKFSTTKSKYFINTSGDNIIVYKKLFLFVFYKHKLFKDLDKQLNILINDKISRNTKKST